MTSGAHGHRNVEVTATLDSAPAPSNLLQMMTGYWVSQAIYVAAKLSIADHLANGPMGVDDLAAVTYCNASSLQRVLRALTSVGVFTETAPGQYGLTPMAALLQTGTPNSVRSLAIVHGDELYRAWADFLHSLQTGQPAFEHHFGMGPFAYYAQHPEAGSTFHEAMIGLTNSVVSAVTAIYDFSPFRTVVDVGGGHGAFLASVLQKNNTQRGILFDQPHVVAGAESFLASAGVADRCTCAGGDFFEAVPSGGDAYVLSQILHDWDDERCVTILQQCRQAIPESGKLLVIELVVPTGPEPSFGKWGDLHMLAITGGRERTADEYDALFRAAGFALADVLPTPAGPYVIEGVPV